MISTERRRRLLLVIGLLCLAAARVAGAQGANLLRNADFQDDWITLLPENLTLHWSYSPAFTNRRDFNPDGWTSKGSWRWIDADAPPGRRRFVVGAPAAEVRQRVNWAAVNDEHKLEGFPDAGGFPSFAAVNSERPLALVRDLAFRVRAKGSDVPDGAATIEVALAPPGRVTSGEPLGTVAPPTASASAPLPAGSFDWSWTEVRLAAAEWQRVAGAQAALPATASVAIRFKGAAGSVEIERAELTAATGFFAGSIATPSASSATKRRGWGRASAMCRKPSAT